MPCTGIPDGGTGVRRPLPPALRRRPDLPRKVSELPDPDASERPSTAVIIINDRGDYLLHLRDAHKPICDSGTWSLVGGGGEGEESLDDTIAREIREETGLVLPDVTAFRAVHAEGPYVTEGHIHVYTAHWEGDAHASR